MKKEEFNNKNNSEFSLKEEQQNEKDKEKNNSIENLEKKDVIQNGEHKNSEQNQNIKDSINEIKINNNNCNFVEEKNVQKESEYNVETLKNSIANNEENKN